MPRYITVPQQITLVNPEDDTPLINGDGSKREPLTFKSFVITVLLADPRWTKSMADIDAAGDILKELKAGKSVLSLDKSVWEKLKGVAEAPSNGYPVGLHPAILPQLLPFLKAIMNASETEPSTTN